jgi:hypothetical protein
MGSRWVGALLTVLVIAGTTGGVVASGGDVLRKEGSASAAQYGTPQAQTEAVGSKTCRDLVTGNRSAEAALRARNTRYAGRYRGRTRAAILRYLRRQERNIHRAHVSAERQCRANGGA